MEKEETKERSLDLRTIREMSFEDICKKQILDVLRIANEKPENLPYAVVMLEKLVQDELPEDYWKDVEKIMLEANRRFPKWERDKGEEIARGIFIALEKFGKIIGFIKQKIPREIILEL